MSQRINIEVPDDLIPLIDQRRWHLHSKSRRACIVALIEQALAIPVEGGMNEDSLTYLSACAYMRGEGEGQLQ